MLESRRVSQGSGIFLYSSLGIRECELCFCEYMGIVFNYIWYIYFCLRISVIACAGRIWKFEGHHGSLCHGREDVLVAGWVTMWGLASACLTPTWTFNLSFFATEFSSCPMNLTCKGGIKRIGFLLENHRMFWNCFWSNVLI